MNPKVDEYLRSVEKWGDELQELRSIVLDCGLHEELKWGSPCYSFGKTNVVIIGGLKDYCVLSFFKGSLLQDTDQLLTKPGENTQSARVISFTNVRRILDLEPILKAYIFEAIEIEKAGLKPTFKPVEDFAIPEEFQRKLSKFPELETAFKALTPGRQKAYLLHFSQPKQASTRESRIEKCLPKILDGIGLNDF